MPRYLVSIIPTPAMQLQSFDLLFVSLHALGETHYGQGSGIICGSIWLGVFPTVFNSRLSLSYYPVHRYLSSLSNKYTFTYQEMVLKEMITFGAQWSPYL